MLPGGDDATLALSPNLRRASLESLRHRRLARHPRRPREQDADAGSSPGMTTDIEHAWHVTSIATSARRPSQRQLRVGELIRHALADMLTRGEVHDPVLEGHI